LLLVKYKWLSTSRRNAQTDVDSNRATATYQSTLNDVSLYNASVVHSVDSYDLKISSSTRKLVRESII
jgi:hypothetical protein